jgi:hypothetical protein
MSETRRKKPVLIRPDYTSHDAHGYKHGLGPCVCDECRKLRVKP